MDGLALGEATAASLGLPLTAMRLGLLAVLALATGTAVAQTGLIAFVGLAAPHLVRSLVQGPHRTSVVLASAMGGGVAVGGGYFGAGLAGPQELPVGVVTASLGAATCWC